jgi:hypothetical protein
MSSDESQRGTALARNHRGMKKMLGKVRIVTPSLIVFASHINHQKKSMSTRVILRLLEQLKDLQWTISG